MKFRTVVQLEYRVAARQHEDTDLIFQDMKRELQEIAPMRVQFHEIEEDTWPVKPETRETFEKKGWFVMNHGSRCELIVRSQPISITCDSFEHAESVLATIFEKFPNTFAVARVAKEYLTEVFAA